MEKLEGAQNWSIMGPQSFGLGPLPDPHLKQTPVS